MKLLHSKLIRHKPAELFPKEDRIVIIRYDGRLISESGGGTLLNIEGIYDLYLQFCVQVFMREEMRSKALDELYEEAGKMGWKNIS